MKVAKRFCCACEQTNNSVSPVRLSALIAGSSLIVIASVLAAHPQPARAADQGSQVAQAESGAGAPSEEIIVTARRKEENLQDVPQAVTAVTGKEFQNLDLLNLQDITSLVGGLNITFVPGFADTVTIRGVTFNPDSTTTETAAFYLNDAWVTNNFVTEANFDVGQVEVLPGPQGTLRGESAPTGSFTLTTHRPDLEKFGGYVNGTVDHLGNTNIQGAINIPIVQDKLAIRIAADADDTDGPADDDVRSVHDSQKPYQHTYAERASIQFKPNDDITANLMLQHLFLASLDYQWEEGTGAPGGTDPLATPNYSGPPLAPSQRLSTDYVPNTNVQHENIAVANIDWTFHGQKLSYVGDYWQWGYTTGPTGNLQVPGITPSNPISQGIYPQSTQWTYGQELRLASDEPGRFWDYTVGAYYRRSLDHVYNYTNEGGPQSGAFGSPLGPANPDVYNNLFDIYIDTIAPRVEHEFSTNASFTFHLPGDNELTAGTRWIDYREHGTINSYVQPGSDVAEPLPAALCGAFGGSFGATYPGVCNIPVPSSDAFSAKVLGKGYNWVYNASLSHKFNDDLLAYVNSGSSWRPPAYTVGVYNASNNATLNSILDMKPEKSYSFEGGIKSTWLDKRIRLNLDFYHQIYSPAIAGGSASVYYLADTGAAGATPAPAAYPFSYNAPAKVNGIDVDAGFQITQDWSSSLSAGWSHSKITGDVPCNPSGALPPAASAFPAGTYVFECPASGAQSSLSTQPDFTASLQSEYVYPINDRLDAFLRGLFTFYGRNPHYAFYGSSAYYTVPSYEVLNLYAGLKSSDGAWQIMLFAKNALDKSVLAFGGPDLASPQLASFGFGAAGYTAVNRLTPPQAFGLNIIYAWGSR